MGFCYRKRNFSKSAFTNLVSILVNINDPNTCPKCLVQQILQFRNNSHTTKNEPRPLTLKAVISPNVIYTDDAFKYIYFPKTASMLRFHF